MRSPPKSVLWTVPVVLLSCVVVYEAQLRDGPAAAPPRPTVNHELHAARDLLCIDCHDPEETGEPAMPAAAVCLDCHEDLAQENDRVRAYFDASRLPDGSYRFERPAYMSDLIVNHKGHAAAKIDCAACHGEPTTAAFARPAPLALMESCSACHVERGAPNECATCHLETRKDVKPADHDDAYRRTHGQVAPPGWREGRGESCAICHEVPSSCNDCHVKTKPENHLAKSFASVHGREAPRGWQLGEGGNCALCHQVPNTCNDCHTRTRPASHRWAGFRLHHGTGDTDAGMQPFGETSCALCHTEQSCVRCHQTTEPRNHTQPFKRRLHGITAGVERQSCTTCHQQDWCLSCHQTTQPLTHRGNFARGQQSHCLGCHEPLSSTGCFTCHKSTLGHLGHTPKPLDAKHLGASDPVDCESCHLVLPHLNDGGRCGRCHR